MRRSELEKGWRELFDVHVDVQNDLNIISTKLINKYLGEVRLATKFDNRKQLPKVFKDNNYFLLPLKNQGDFAIVRGDGFHDLEEIQGVKEHKSLLKKELQTLNGGRNSESKYLDYALHTGLLENFLNVSGLHLSFRGREYCKKFEFTFNGISLEAESVQLEVDGGYESTEQPLVVIIEAKINSMNNFNIRQIYYPLRTYMTKI